jgi:hypothetical protein
MFTLFNAFVKSRSHTKITEITRNILNLFNMPFFVPLWLRVKNRLLTRLLFGRFILALALLMLSFPAHADEVAREQIKGLDEQVQEIKSDALSIAAELNQLEEKLLYPSTTQVAVFVSLVSGETFRLDSVEIQLDGKPVARHLYTFKELEALQKGGVQRIYTGNVRSGDHDLQVVVMGKTGGGSDVKKSERFNVTKDAGPRIVELSLAAQSITLR